MEAATYIFTAFITLAVIGGITVIFLRREIRREADDRKRSRSHHDSALGKEQGFTDRTRGFWVDGAGSDVGGSQDD
ncbi:hypothetical protein [Aliiruegeria lutimaris]|uniref:Uncharacterized protein n=1 Tax=Aliiruegeria lutimaris TaxID=571298 RepID=A0A1G9EU09_9RHOB|nr:hypothetical protein [Aliiruegeria lutimaris]SDK79652.1 hypothetical protein SAMN04488026_105424 [Aliiruegeria lutimaris]